MLSFEKICQKVLNSAELMTKLLLGLLLAFLPFAYGYLYRYAKKVRQDQDVTLPKWQDGYGLLKDGLKFWVILLLFTILPLILAWLLASILGQLLSLIGFSALASLIIYLIFFITVPLTLSALYYFQSNNSYRDLLKIRAISTPVLDTWKQWLLPVLAFIGLVLATKPLYPFAFFFGYLFLVPFSILLFLEKGDACETESDTDTKPEGKSKTREEVPEAAASKSPEQKEDA